MNPPQRAERHSRKCQQWRRDRGKGGDEYVPGKWYYVEVWIDGFRGQSPTADVSVTYDNITEVHTNLAAYGSDDADLDLFQLHTFSRAASTVYFDDVSLIPEPATPVSFDIKPGSWPNPVNVKSHGVLPAAVCGTDMLDVMDIDTDTILLTREGVVEGVSPIRWNYQDVATPFDGLPGEGHELVHDGLLDLALKFETEEVIDVLDLVALRGEMIALTLTGSLLDGTAIEGVDWVWILRPGDMDGNGKVDSEDLAIWQQDYDPLGEDQDTFAMGDCNGDGRVDSADLALWQQNYDPIGPGGMGVTHTPEPATLLLVVVGGLMLAWRKRR